MTMPISTSPRERGGQLGCRSQRRVDKVSRLARTWLALVALAMPPSILAACGARSSLPSEDGAVARAIDAGAGDVVVDASSEDVDAAPEDADADVAAEAATCIPNGLACSLSADCCSGACAGGSCSGAACKPGDPVVDLAKVDTEGGNITLALGAEKVFWTQNKSSGAEIVTVPKGGGDVASFRQGVPDTARGFAVDATSVYWGTWTPSQQKYGPTLVRSGITAGPDVTLTSTPNRLDEVVVNQALVFWIDGLGAYGVPGGQIAQMPIGGAAVTSIAVGQKVPLQLRVNKTSAYWIFGDGQQSIASAPIGGGTVKVLFTAPSAGINGIAVDESHLYYAVGTSIFAADKDGSNAMPLVVAKDSVVQPIVTGGFVYFQEPPDKILKVPVTGGPVQQIATAKGSAFQMQVDDSCVFWRTSNDPGGNGPGLIQRAPR